MKIKKPIDLRILCLSCVMYGFEDEDRAPLFNRIMRWKTVTPKRVREVLDTCILKSKAYSNPWMAYGMLCERLRVSVVSGGTIPDELQAVLNRFLQVLFEEYGSSFESIKPPLFQRAFYKQELTALAVAKARTPMSTYTEVKNYHNLVKELPNDVRETILSTLISEKVYGNGTAVVFYGLATADKFVTSGDLHQLKDAFRALNTLMFRPGFTKESRERDRNLIDLLGMKTLLSWGWNVVTMGASTEEILRGFTMGSMMDVHIAPETLREIHESLAARGVTAWTLSQYKLF